MNKTAESGVVPFIGDRRNSCQFLPSSISLEPAPSSRNRLKENPMDKKSEHPLVLTRNDLKRMGIKVSNASLLRWEALGRFPRRIRMAGCSVAWIAAEIDAWINERRAERAHHHYADAKF
jgi:prophage regulatory protein